MGSFVACRVRPPVVLEALDRRPEIDVQRLFRLVAPIELVEMGPSVCRIDPGDLDVRFGSWIGVVDSGGELLGRVEVGPSAGGEEVDPTAVLAQFELEAGRLSDERFDEDVLMFETGDLPAPVVVVDDEAVGEQSIQVPMDCAHVPSDAFREVGNRLGFFGGDRFQEFLALFGQHGLGVGLFEDQEVLVSGPSESPRERRFPLARRGRHRFDIEHQRTKPFRSFHRSTSRTPPPGTANEYARVLLGVVGSFLPTMLATSECAYVESPLRVSHMEGYEWQLAARD